MCKTVSVQGIPVALPPGSLAVARRKPASRGDGEGGGWEWMLSCS